MPNISFIFPIKELCQHALAIDYLLINGLLLVELVGVGALAAAEGEVAEQVGRGTRGTLLQVEQRDAQLYL